MKRPKRDPVREDRIHNEAFVDANGPEEQVMGWYYYLDDKIRFPFQAQCIAAKVVSPLNKGETVEVQPMAPEDACSADVLVMIRWQSRTMAVLLSQLAGVNVDESTAEAIADWHYWVAQGHSLTHRRVRTLITQACRKLTDKPGIVQAQRARRGENAVPSGELHR